MDINSLKKQRKVTKNNQITYLLTWEQFRTMHGEGLLRGATLHETLGPLWKDLYLSPVNRPYVLKTARC